MEFRRAICDMYKAQGVELSPDQVLITPGTKQALFNLFSILLRQGDEVVVPTPAWFGFHELMKYSRGKLVPVETKLEEHYRLTPEKLRKSLSSRSRILLLTNPGNPTGRLYTKAELEALLEVVQEYPDLYLISDEIYDHLTYGEPATPLLSCQGAPQERSVLLSGFSKTFAMSGWRLGFMAGPEELIKKCTDFQASTLAGVSVFLQDAAIATLNKRDKALPPMLEVLAHNRQVMKEGLDRIPHVRFYLPEGAYYFFPDLSHYLHTETPGGEPVTSTMDLCRYLKEEHGVEMVPGDYFGAPGHVRMSFAIETERLQEAMQRLQEGLSVLKQ